MKVYAVAGLVLALCGCLSWQSQDSAKVAQEEIVECRYEVPVGSVMRKRVCRTVSQTAAESARGQATLDEQERMRTDAMMRRTEAMRNDRPGG